MITAHNTTSEQRSTGQLKVEDCYGHSYSIRNRDTDNTLLLWTHHQNICFNRYWFEMRNIVDKKLRSLMTSSDELPLYDRLSAIIIVEYYLYFTGNTRFSFTSPHITRIAFLRWNHEWFLSSSRYATIVAAKKLEPILGLLLWQINL